MSRFTFEQLDPLVLRNRRAPPASDAARPGPDHPGAGPDGLAPTAAQG